MWASSCVNWRTRISPCSAPCGSLRWQVPYSDMRMGRSRYDLMPWRKIRTWAGQFIGFSAIRSAVPEKIGPSSSVLGVSSGMTNMFSRYLPQWPDFSHWRASITCGVLTSRYPAASRSRGISASRSRRPRRLDLEIARGVELAAHIGLKLPPDEEALGVPEHAAVRFGLEVEQVH